ncbi:membrane dipeptidase [Enterococcus sp. PF1-24]|uniref:dipeptidase n=1 Tax=unclassified Enterococcus TaxID=2608891 RepID=UPI002475900D|nr:MULTISPECIES: dipeptidase [unclassified Enterococcus]MDH6365752.1 membrane dipeptidase [Enterococcus sp. PFB1-1]MDH6402852.1 membrane dipeptidase [Enterococcus sp. PF1-24]
MKIVDLHCDTIWQIYESQKQGKPQTLRKNTFQLDQTKMQQGNYLLQNFAIFMDIEKVTDPYQEAIGMINCFYQELADNRDWLAPAKSYQEIIANQKADKISGMLTMEEGAPLQGDVARVAEFYDLGVRMLTLTWNYPNQLGFPNCLYVNQKTAEIATQQQGLTEIGVEVVKEMNRVGMIIDVSHGSDQLVRDVLQHSQKALVASHSNVRQLANHSRNLSDELIRKIANQGGLIGINYYEAFVRAVNASKMPFKLAKAFAKKSLVSELVEHIYYLKNLAGIEVIALGSDFDGIPPHPELADGSTVMKIADELAKKQFTAKEIDQILGENVLRFYRENL